MLDFIEFIVQAGDRAGVIPAEIAGSLLFLVLGYKGYVGTKDGAGIDIVESLVHFGSVAFMAFGAGGLLAVVIQFLFR